jgi:hypothetical protein
MELDLPSGTHQLAPFSLPDTTHDVNVTFTMWSPVVTASVQYHFSFDNGATWEDFGSSNPMAGLMVPPDPPYGATFLGIPYLCATCSQPANRWHKQGDLDHSTVAFKSGRNLAALKLRLAARDQTVTLQSFKKRVCIAEDGRDIDGTFFARTFHTPTFKTGQVRLLRPTLFVSGGQFISTLAIETQ